MSDDAQQNPEISPEKDDDLQEVFAHTDNKDWFLQDIIRLVDLGLSMGITLTVGGTVISGQLISGKVYFEKIATLVRGGSTNLGGDTLSAIGDSFERYTAIYDKPDDADENWRSSLATYIHLERARHYIPGQHGMPGDGTLWRGRLAEVSGFSLGEYNYS